ncbi:hypothetical protein ACU4GA_15780 [Methylobacterium oryzae CBMB20]
MLGDDVVLEAGAIVLGAVPIGDRGPARPADDHPQSRPGRRGGHAAALAASSRTGRRGVSGPMTDHVTLPGLRRLLAADFARVLHQTTGGKPTSRLRRMVHLTLPAMQVAILHRTAHLLHGRGRRRCAALVADLSLRLTGASLHPGSRLGPGLFVPHPARVAFCGTGGAELTLLPGTLVEAAGLGLPEPAVPRRRPQPRRRRGWSARTPPCRGPSPSARARRLGSGSAASGMSRPVP